MAMWDDLCVQPIQVDTRYLVQVCVWNKQPEGWYGYSTCGQGVKYTSQDWEFCPYCGDLIQFKD